MTAHIKAKSKVKSTDIFMPDDDTSLSARPPRLTLAIPEGRSNGDMTNEKRMRQRRRIDSNNAEIPNGVGMGLVSSLSDGDLGESPVFVEAEKHMAAETSPVYSSAHSNGFDENSSFERERRKESFN